MKKTELDTKKVYKTLAQWKSDYMPKRVEIEYLSFLDKEQEAKLQPKTTTELSSIRERFLSNIIY